MKLHSWAWQKLRREILREEPVCRPCSGNGLVTAADEVDHIVPRSEGGGFERENLQPICRPCHERKTARENRTTPLTVAADGSTELVWDETKLMFVSPA